MPGSAPIVDGHTMDRRTPRPRPDVGVRDLSIPDGIEPDKERTVALLEACKTHGLLVGKGGLYGNVIRLSPMLNSTADEIDELIASLTSAIVDVS